MTKTELKQLSQCKEMVEKLNSTNSKNEKMEILGQYGSLKTLLKYVYNPYWKFGITTKILKANPGLTDTKADKLYNLLDHLRNRIYTGHEAIRKVNGFIDKNNDYRELLYNIIDRNLKTRTDAKLINKVFPDLIPTFEVALAQKFEDHAHKIDWNDTWYGSRKLDGVRVLARKEKNKVKFFSRNGNEFGTLDIIKGELDALGADNFVLDGEMCIIDDNGSENYKAIVSQIKRKNYTVEKPMYVVFDVLTLKEFDDGHSQSVLSDRLKLIQPYAVECSHINKLEMSVITDEKHAVAKLDEAVKQGWEGYMMRRDCEYEGKRTRNLLKMKKMQDAEYTVQDIEVGPIRIIDKSSGLDKTIEALTSVIIEHKGCKVSVGSGFSIDDRIKYYKNPELIIGKEITVKYFEESMNKKGDVSLRFPVVKYVFESGKRTV